MKYLIPTCLILLSCGSLAGQDNSENRKTGGGYCESGWCTLSKDDPAHFDPYYNGHLCENFNPRQTDFSEEYLKLQRRQGHKNIVEELSSYDLSRIWVTADGQQNGIIGLDYQRIRIHISIAARDTRDNLLYHVQGKSIVSGNVCDFSGQIRLTEAYALPGEHKRAGVLFAAYTFHEDRTQKHVGTFQGVVECFYFLDEKDKKGFLDESSDIADGYYNRTYVGTWQGYNSKAPRKCIWGDYRLPFTFDFDCGDGAMIVCDDYVKNGWASFNDGSDFVVVNGKGVLKDRWWVR